MATMDGRRAVILDVDTGIDDALALLYALGDPDVELVAVTCVAGNVGAAQVADNTRALLALAGRPDVPVALGATEPLVKPLRTTPETHGPTGLGYAQLDRAMQALEPRHAADVIADACARRPGELDLVTLGPLTTLAIAVERHPDLLPRLRSHVLMAGAYGVPGNTTPVAEWNVHVDPDAARAVFAAWSAALEAGTAGTPTPPLAMGLDVTERARIVPADVAGLALAAGAHPADAAALADTDAPMRPVGSIAGDPILRFVVDSLRFYFEFHARYDGFYGAFIHDPFALAAAMDPSLVATRRVFVDVETGPGLAHAMTIADWRGHTGRPANARVATAGDAAEFVRRLTERVARVAGTARLVAR
jgi:purine nucleosidase